MYLASVVDNAMMGYFLELQEIAPPSMMNVYPNIECQCSCDAQSASEKPVRPTSPSPMTSHLFIVPFRYQNTLFTASQWGQLGFCMNWERTEMVKAISGCVPKVAYISEPMAS